MYFKFFILLLCTFNFSYSAQFKDLSDAIIVHEILPFLTFDLQFNLAHTNTLLQNLIFQDFARILLQHYPELESALSDPMKKRQLVACIMRPCAYYYKNLYQERVPPPEHWSNYEIFILAVISRPSPILSDVKLASFLVKRFVFLDNTRRSYCNHDTIVLNIVDHILPRHSINKSVMQPFLKFLKCSRSNLLRIIYSKYHLSSQSPLYTKSIVAYITNPLIITHFGLQYFHFFYFFLITCYLLKDHIHLILIIVASVFYTKYMYNNFLPF